MDSVLFDKSLTGKLENSPSRFDMAVNFHCCVKKSNKYYVLGFYYNPIWNVYYPFYDDVNKTPVLVKSKAKTYSELAKECGEVLNVNLSDKLNLAYSRFKEIFGCGCKVKKSDNFEMFELKFSKTTNLYTVYKLFNYIITDVEDISKLLNSKLKCKLFDLKKLGDDLVGNAVEFCKKSKAELIKNAIII